jgi:type II secretory pathway component GspD/PulD (secretin)
VRFGLRQFDRLGGLIQDEVGKARNKVPLLGDVPVLGYLFQEHLHHRLKRNLLVFVTPTILPDPISQPIAGSSSGGTTVGTIRP